MKFPVDKEFFGMAATEMANGHVDADLLAKSLALSDGDEIRGKALYIKLRAKELASKQNWLKKKLFAISNPDSNSNEDIERGTKALKDVAWFIAVVLVIFIIAAVALSR